MKISVIIPIYNAEEYLERCLDSIINQTYKNLEIICINDCSTDKSLEILNSYAQNDNRIKVIDCKTNGGESKARNIGLDNATGDYIAFVDNDDELDLDFYEKLAKEALCTNADIIKGQTKEYDYNMQLIPPKDNHKQILKNKMYFLTYWWSAIYKHKIIKEYSIRLPEGFPLGGDIYFRNKFLLNCKDIATVNGTYYHYYRREDSGNSKKLSTEKIASSVHILNMMTEDLNDAKLDKQEPEMYDYLVFSYIKTILKNSFRATEAKGKEKCADGIISLYSKSPRKDSLLKNFTKNKLLFSSIQEHILKKNSIDLSKILLACKDLNILVLKNIETIKNDKQITR